MIKCHVISGFLFALEAPACSSSCLIDFVHKCSMCLFVLNNFQWGNIETVRTYIQRASANRWKHFSTAHCLSWCQCRFQCRMPCSNVSLCPFVLSIFWQVSCSSSLSFASLSSSLFVSSASSSFSCKVALKSWLKTALFATLPRTSSFVSNVDWQIWKHLRQAKHIQCGKNDHNHEIISTRNFLSRIQVNRIFYDVNKG